MIAGQACPVGVVADATAERETPDSDRQAGATRQDPLAIDRRIQDVLVASRPPITPMPVSLLKSTLVIRPRSTISPSVIE